MYVVLRGTQVKVLKPDGKTADHVMRRTVAIPSGTAQLIGYNLHYKISDYTIIVRADKAVYVTSQCPQCKGLL